MAHRDIIVIGASAGGVEVLKTLVHGLQADIPAAIFVVLHVSPHSKSVLPEILTRHGPLKAVHATNGQPILPGSIYIAPPNHQMLLKPGYIKLTQGPKENGHRPSVDVLFRTAARTYRTRVIALVLSGVLDDGSAGVIAVKDQGGVAIAQDPSDTLYPGMPQNAIETGKIDYVSHVPDLADLLYKLASETVEDVEMVEYKDVTEMENHGHQIHEKGGQPTTYVCPDCGGVMMEYNEGDFIRFRCQVGHAYSAGSMLAKQNEAIEDAIWMGLRALEENADLSHRLAERAQQRGHVQTEARFLERARQTEDRAALLRRLLMNGDTLYTDTSTEE